MLHGTSESVEFAELLEFLAAREKSGVLHLHHQGVDVQLHFHEGLLREPRAPGASPPGDGHGGGSWLTQVCCDVLQWRHFSFDFEPGDGSSGASGLAREEEVEEVSVVLAQARSELAEWRAIRSVIPSLDSRPEPVAEIEDRVVLEPDDWRLIVAMDRKRTVEALVRTVGGTRISTCREIRELMDRGLVRLMAQPPAPTVRIEPAGRAASSDAPGGHAAPSDAASGNGSELTEA